MKRNFSLSSMAFVVASLLILSVVLSSCSFVSVQAPPSEDHFADTNDGAANRPEENDSKKPENNDGNHEATDIIDDGDIDIDVDGRPDKDNNNNNIQNKIYQSKHF